MKVIYLGDKSYDSWYYEENPELAPPLTIGKEYTIGWEMDGDYWIEEADDGSDGWHIFKDEFKKVRNRKNWFGLKNKLD